MTLKIPKEPAALICGSVAYDTILVFPDRFQTHILPDKLHTLNVSFLVPEMRREFGGCAANIAYGLNLLGDRGIAMATAGHDFAPYRDRMLSQGLSVQHIRAIDDTFTAQAFITTDLDNNQITAFPSRRDAVRAFEHDRRCRGRNYAGHRRAGWAAGHDRARGAVPRSLDPFYFRSRPGNAHVRGEELKTFIRQARWLALNDYEWGMLQQKTGLNDRGGCLPSRGVDRHLGLGRIDHLYRRTDVAHSLRQAKSSNRPYGLRGCLSGWSNSRVAARPGLGNDRQDGLPDGRDQDRIARAAESPLYPDRV